MRRAGRIWLLFIAALLCVFPGCRSAYQDLVREDSLPDLRAAKHATISRPVKTTMAPTRGMDASELKLAVHSLEGVHADRVLVLIHGVFADHDTWRFISGDLARDHGVWMVDLPGCGASESPVESQTAYTIGDSAERTLQALRHCLVGAGSPKVALVGHSYGAAVIVRMLSDADLRRRYEDVVNQVDRLVLISPLDVALSTPAPVYKQVAEASGLKIWTASLLGELRRRVATATINSVADPARALREEADKRIEILRSAGRRKALQEMIARAIPWTPELRPDWPRIEVLEGAYSAVDRDCLIVVGMRDEALPSSMAYKLAVQMPRTSLVPLKGVMHSPHIEAHDRCASLIREFVTTGRVNANALAPRPGSEP